MKKLLTFVLLLVAAAATLTSCDKQKQLARRLDGTWDIKTVKYKATITIPPGLEVPIEGTATNGGYFTFDRKTLRNDFKISFNTEATSLLGQAIPSIPVNIEQTNNTWTNTIDSLYINGTGTTSTNYKYVIIENGKKTQQWASKFELTDIPTIPGAPVEISKVEVEFMFDMTKRKK